MPQEWRHDTTEARLVKLGAAPENKEAAIRAVGELLVQSSSAMPEYTDSMLRRENVANTWLGEGVAIPHGMVEDKHLVMKDSVAVLQIPHGIEWSNGEKAYLVFGIAARGDGHLGILRRLTQLLQKPEELEKLFTTTDADDIIKRLLEAGTDTKLSAEAHDLDEIQEWVVDYPNGLHARPASIWMNAERESKVRLQVRNGHTSSDLRSLVSLLQLGARCGDTLVFSASGPDAQKKLGAFMNIVRGLSASEQELADLAAEQQNRVATNGWKPPSNKTAITGVAASPGLAIGKIYRVMTEEIELSDSPIRLAEGGPLLQNALERTRLQMKALIDDVKRRIGATDAAIFKAQAELLNDENLIAAACRYIVQGHGVAWAWRQAVEETAGRLAAMNNPVLAGRAADLRDVGRRVLSQIDPEFATGNLTDLPSGQVIIVADDLSPSDTAGLDTSRVCGLATILGGPTSHTAILARTLGLPALVAGGAALASARNGTMAIINGDNGAIWLEPDEQDLAAAQAEMQAIEERRKSQAAQRSLPAHTPDGHDIMVAANINQPDQVPLALEQGGEGVGLMRTEFLFLESGDTPDEDEQFETYRAMLDALDGRPLIVRALDIGGDKQVAHLNLPHEQNPFLGVRGTRLLLRRPDLLYPQLKALYRAARDGGDLSIMFPMIMSIEEVIKLKTIAEDIRDSLKAPKVPLGIMIEVPSATIMADMLAAHVDFFSIGTNDLTQYTFAVDRQNPELAAEADSLHPAVLRMVERTIWGAKQHKRPVGVCGGIAGDPFGAMLLAGLGVTELSMTPRDIAAVKARLRETSFKDMQGLAQQAIRLETTAQIRALDGASQ